MTSDSSDEAHSPVMSAYTRTSWDAPSMARTSTVSSVNGRDSRFRSSGSIGDSHSAVSSTPPAVRVKTDLVAVTRSDVWVRGGAGAPLISTGPAQA
jgi:hypothetical protein